MIKRKAKIVATIGPNSQDESVLFKLIDAGMNVARLNFSHGTHEEHANRITSIRKISSQLNQPITILQDLQGPKLRVGNLPTSGIFLEKGQHVILSSDPRDQPDKDTKVIPMEVPNLENSVQSGNRILLDDGNLELIVTSINNDTINAEVIVGGKLTSHKGVNLPGALIDTASFTEKDHDDLVFGLTHDVDAIAISFVRSAWDIETVRQAIRQIDPNKVNIPIIAKLERPEAIEHLDQIIQRADGVMVARGDLAVETSTALVPIIQKRIIESANRQSKIVITATQMLESMIHNPRPTRAEASDVANAIFDGTDAVMLSAETATGSYPIESVCIMDAIINEAEMNYSKWGHCENIEEQTQDDALSISRAARALAHDRNVASIAVFTRSGRTALLMSKARPNVPIMAFTPDCHTYQILAMYWGITPFLVPFATTVESMLSYVETALISQTLVKPGQQIVIISGYPVGAFRSANLTLLHTVGKPVQ